MSDYEIRYDNEGNQIMRNISTAFDINDPNTSYNFGYGQRFGAILNQAGGNSFLGPSLERYDASGTLVQSQLKRGKGPGGGQFMTNSISQGQFQSNVAKALITPLKGILLANYDRMIGSGISGEHSGMLRLSVAEGEFSSNLQAGLDNSKFDFKLKDKTRPRRRRQFGKSGGGSSSPANSTIKYAQLIFRGRGAIQTGNRMIFPRYGNSDGSMGVFTKRVRGVPAQNIFLLTKAQTTMLKDALLPVTKSHILAQIREAKKASEV